MALTELEALKLEKLKREKARRQGAQSQQPNQQQDSKSQIERQTLGAVTNVPGATSRAAIRENPALALAGPLAGVAGLSGVGGQKAQQAAGQGALNPSQVETFQNQAIDAGINSFGGPSTNVGVNFMKGLPGSVAGLAVDIATDPTQVLLSLLGGLKPSRIKSIGEVVDKPILKAINPTVKGVKNDGQIKQFTNHSRSAVESIVNNKQNLQLVDDVGNVNNKLPENLSEFSQSISQTKKSIFKQYDKMAQEVGQTGAKVNTSNIADDILEAISSKQIEDLSPAVQNYGLGVAERLAKRKSYSLQEAQDAIEALNNKLNSYFTNPHPESIQQAVIDSAIVNQLRSGLIKAIETQKGPQYEILRKQYGSLNALEQSVTKAAFKDSKSNASGLGRIFDVFSSGDIVDGIVSMNPGRITKGAFQIGIKNLYNKMNNPNRIIKKMFEDVDKMKNIDPARRQLQLLLKKVKYPIAGANVGAVNSSNQ